MTGMHFRHYKQAGVSFGVVLDEKEDRTVVWVTAAVRNRKDQFSRRAARELMVLRFLKPEWVQMMGLDRHVYTFNAVGRVSLRDLFSDLENLRESKFGPANEVFAKLQDYCAKRAADFRRDMKASNGRPSLQEATS
jgi:hypothetical protein